jgi:DNA repair exonuclease SbcCD ATPase subunit
MRLLSLDVEHFRAIQSARLRFGRGLNVVYGPNDHGKSTLTDAIRAALLVAPGTAEARSFQTWGGVAGQFPRVVLGFEIQGAVWRVEKVFAQGTRVKARLEKSTDGGVRYLTHAESRDVEGKLRELLNWGIAPPGGRGAPQRAETYLTTALLGKQGEVGSIFDATLKRDQDDTGRALVTRALDALGQDPVVTRLLGILKERTGEAYTEKGRHKRGADSPLVRAQATLSERETRVRELQETARRGKEIEDEIRALMQERETALDEHDRARTRLHALRERLASTARREQLQRDAAALRALEAARQEYSQAQEALEAVETSVSRQPGPRMPPRPWRKRRETDSRARRPRTNRRRRSRPPRHPRVYRSCERSWRGPGRVRQGCRNGRRSNRVTPRPGSRWRRRGRTNSAPPRS